MKVKKSVPRTYATNGYRLRAGCLCFRDERQMELLLVTSSKKGWIVPAGGIDPGENALDAAVREVREEAGVIGDVGACVDVFCDDKRQTLTYIYPMVVRELVPPLEQKKRKWFSVGDAVLELNHRPIQQTYLAKNIYNATTKIDALRRDKCLIRQDLRLDLSKIDMVRVGCTKLIK